MCAHTTCTCAHVASSLHCVCARACLAVTVTQCVRDRLFCMSQCLCAWVPQCPPGRWPRGCSPPPTPSTPWQLFLFLLCLHGSLLPLSCPKAHTASGEHTWRRTDPHLFPQVPPGADETPKAPGTSELDGGHLQGTRIPGRGEVWKKRGAGAAGRGLAHTGIHSRFVAE